jgi:outer membrane protein TolC
LVEQAQEALTLAQSRYERGVITNFELLDAQSAARAAELSRIQARYDRTLADEALARAVGRKPVA